MIFSSCLNIIHVEDIIFFYSDICLIAIMTPPLSLSLSLSPPLPLPLSLPPSPSLSLSQDIVIGTPGRLRDLIEEGVCNLSEVSFVVSLSLLSSVVSYSNCRIKQCLF